MIFFIKRALLGGLEIFKKFKISCYDKSLKEFCSLTLSSDFVMTPIAVVVIYSLHN